MGDVDEDTAKIRRLIKSLELLWGSVRAGLAACSSPLSGSHRPDTAREILRTRHAFNDSLDISTVYDQPPLSKRSRSWERAPVPIAPPIR